MVIVSQVYIRAKKNKTNQQQSNTFIDFMQRVSYVQQHKCTILRESNTYNDTSFKSYKQDYLVIQLLFWVLIRFWKKKEFNNITDSIMKLFISCYCLIYVSTISKFRNWQYCDTNKSPKCVLIECYTWLHIITIVC